MKKANLITPMKKKTYLVGLRVGSSNIEHVMKSSYAIYHELGKSIAITRDSSYNNAS